MVTLSYFLAIYLFGGITLLPLVVCILLCHAWLTFPKRNLGPSSPVDTAWSRKVQTEFPDTDISALRDHPKVRPHESDVAAGYFAVCRNYVPGGVNGKPPERTTPTGAVAAAESPSVYQSMYRSIFDRNKTQSLMLEGGRTHGKPTKRARNTFYVVLRHGYLMLYDDSEQLEVRHVISLAHHNVDVYAGGEHIPEGELWIKRNCIRLVRKDTAEDDPPESRPFFIFSDSCSEKEDFYHALLQNQETRRHSICSPPLPLQFESAHIMKLVQQLHASEETLQTRWLNAVIGRMFLALYKTSEVEQYIRTKITKKIARVSKPAFLTSIKIQNINLGDSAPLITNPKLKELTVDGALTVEADVRYDGNFKLEIAAVARIELGSRFKAREVNLILAGIFKKLEGHVLLRVKPPPSNRLWISFETMPNMEMSIEPIVSSRQITYGIILRAIESRIREVIGETVVLPNWDDVPFLDTTSQRFRGGIWEEDAKASAISEQATTAHEQPPKGQTDREADVARLESSVTAPSAVGKANSMLSLLDTPPSGLRARKSAMSNSTSDTSADTTDLHGQAAPEKPKVMRSQSFATTASPILSVDSATVAAIRSQTMKGTQDAVSAMKEISTRSQSHSPIESPVGSPSTTSMIPSTKTNSFSSMSFRASEDNDHLDETVSTPPEQSLWQASLPTSRNDDVDSIRSSSSHDLETSNMNSPSHTSSVTEKKHLAHPSVGSATAAAKKWGWNMINRHNGTKPSPKETVGFGHQDPPLLPNQPVGRGQPLPPPGTPLPKPERASWSSSSISTSKRKPVPPPPLPARPGASTPRPVPAPPLPLRKYRHATEMEAEPADDGLFVVATPADSVPSSPNEDHLSYRRNLDQGSVTSTSSQTPQETRLGSEEILPEDGRKLLSADDANDVDETNLRILEAAMGRY
ncbi:hypothetical protein LTR04_002400 [Oleoguttula sp. CCFEE 6159]|nr:hypothetical protein LTR04_002400 [Oleoguttula sp. CCFEE 6159]